MATKKKRALLVKPKLSDIPSKAIRQALDDLAAVEAQKDLYTVDMCNYHVYDAEDAKCAVCFAGAVIAGAGNDPKRNLEPSSFDDKTHNKLRGLDCFRGGDIAEAINFFGVKKIPLLLNTDDSFYVDVTDYDDNPKKFKKDMNELADNLEKLGL